MEPDVPRGSHPLPRSSDPLPRSCSFQTSYPVRRKTSRLWGILGLVAVQASAVRYEPQNNRWVYFGKF